MSKKYLFDRIKHIQSDVATDDFIPIKIETMTLNQVINSLVGIVAKVQAMREKEGMGWGGG